MGALMPLREEWAWYQWGSMTEAEAAAAWNDIIVATYESAASSACIPDLQTPYWDEASDVDVSEPADTQTWYGTVPDPEAAPDSLDFVENALVWAFTGLIAAATWEVGAAPAILFHTIAPKFLIATKAGDVGEIFRILVDGQEQARIDTTGHAGEIVQTPCYGDPSLSDHELYVIQVT